MARLTTHAEEQAARLQSEKEAPFKATHTYNPTGWDAFDSRGVQGEPIAPGSKIQLMKEHNKGLHQGMPGEAKKMFNVVRDEAGNMQHISRSSMDNFHDRRGEERQ
jgi:hypothetical protein